MKTIKIYQKYGFYRFYVYIHCFRENAEFHDFLENMRFFGLGPRENLPRNAFLTIFTIFTIFTKIGTDAIASQYSIQLSVLSYFVL